MSKLTARLRRIEQVFGNRLCSTCRGQAPIVVSHVHEQEPPPTVSGCPECGEVTHILLQHVTEPPIAERQSCLA